jgi:hypothetical protein
VHRGRDAEDGSQRRGLLGLTQQGLHCTNHRLQMGATPVSLEHGDDWRARDRDELREQLVLVRLQHSAAEAH